MTVRELHRRLTPLMFRDQRRLQRRLDGARKLRDPQRRAEAALAEIAADVVRAEQRLATRRAAVPDDHLPGGAAGQRSAATTSPPRSATTRW